jgi:hypothetical protein
MLIFFCGKLLKSLAPTARLWASTQMLYLVDKAIKTGEVDKLKLFACVGLAGFLSTGLRTVRNFLYAHRPAFLAQPIQQKLC